MRYTMEQLPLVHQTSVMVAGRSENEYAMDIPLAAITEALEFEVNPWQGSYASGNTPYSITRVLRARALYSVLRTHTRVLLVYSVLLLVYSVLRTPTPYSTLQTCTPRGAL